MHDTGTSSIVYVRYWYYQYCNITILVFLVLYSVTILVIPVSRQAASYYPDPQALEYRILYVILEFIWGYWCSFFNPIKTQFVSIAVISFIWKSLFCRLKATLFISWRILLACKLKRDRTKDTTLFTIYNIER